MPVYPDGEIVSDEFVPVVAALKRLGVLEVAVHVVWIHDERDVEFYESIGIEVDCREPTRVADLHAPAERWAGRAFIGGAVAPGRPAGAAGDVGADGGYGGAPG